MHWAGVPAAHASSRGATRPGAHFLPARARELARFLTAAMVLRVAVFEAEADPAAVTLHWDRHAVLAFFATAPALCRE